MRETRALDPDEIDATSLLLGVPEAILVVREGSVVAASDDARGLIGADPVGRPVAALVARWSGTDVEVGDGPGELLPDHGEPIPVQLRTRTIPGGLHMISLRTDDPREAGPADDAAREAEAKYRTLVEQIPAIVYIDVEGRGTTYVSPQVEAILGLTPDEYCAAGVEGWLAMVHPDDRDRVAAEYSAFVVGSGGDLSDYRMVASDGRVVWIRDRAVTIRDDAGRVMLEHGVMFDITEVKEAEAQISHLAYHDRLTGLANRTLFEETLELAIRRARRGGDAVAVLFLDLDNFKLVNDSLGHHAGDRLLSELGQRLLASVRDTDLVARQGGDEFLILLADLERDPEGDPDDLPSEARSAERVADRIRRSLDVPFDLGKSEFFARGSIGISLFPRDGDDGSTILKNADEAMYRAKRYDPGRHAFFAGSSGDATARLSFATRLRRAVEQEDWVLQYEPVVDLEDGRMVGAETLVRWQDASGGIVAPGEFIPVAEELGLIEAIGDWVLGEMARRQRLWGDAGLDLDLSFNLSPRQLWAPHLAGRILTALHDVGVPPQRVIVEITESSAMADPDRTQGILAELRAWGIRVALDDFGTGFSSLARLKHLPVDILKIDREFVQHVDRDGRLAGMVRALIHLARSLDMVPLAEGVETEDEYRFLRSNGCRLAQGFWFSRPVPADAIPRLAEARSLLPGRVD